MDIAIGIDIGGTNSPFGIVDRQGKVLASGTLKTGQFQSAKEFTEVMASLIKTELEHLEDYHLSGIGIGAPNGNYYNGTIEFAPNLNWTGVIDLVTLFQKYLDVPVFVTNDANAAAIGEFHFGDGANRQNFMVVTLGTGVGSGFVANGKLIYGADGFAGELGHTIIEEDGRDCTCGRQGCLETYASVNGMLRTAHIMLQESSQESELREIPAEAITGRIICDAARNGDEVANKIIDFTARKLAFSLANTVAITSPEVIYLFGGLAKAGGIILNPVKRHMENYLLNLYKGKVKIKISTLTERNAAVLGAAALVWNSLEKNQNEKAVIN